jgi:HSP20 family protein
MALPLLRRHDDAAARQQPAPAVPAVRDPLRELEELRERLDRVLRSPIWPLGAGPSDDVLGWAPAVDVEEADDAWIVEAELPGMKEKDIDVELHGTELTISGDVEERKRRGILRRSARRVGRFDYRVNLPGISDTEEVRATLDEGVLTVRVPKPEHAKRRRIQIQKG